MKALHLSIIVILVIVSSTDALAFAQVAPTLGLPHAFFKTDNAVYPIQYNLTNGKLVANLVDLPARELIFRFNATGDGQLTVELPRDIIDSTRDGKDKPYLVFVDDMYSGTTKRVKADEIQTTNSDRTLTIDFTKEDNEIGIVGTFFVENKLPYKITNLFGAFSPLQQYKKGFDAQDIVCKDGLVLIIKAEDDTPACVKPQTAQKFVERGWGWAMQTIDSLKPLLPNRIIGLENDTGVATLGNQTYYFETPNYTNTAYSNPVQIPFHGVVFTLFPPGFRGGLPTDTGCEGTITGILTGSGSYYWTDAKFPDGIHELLHIFAYSKISCPVHSIPTYFSTHANPQAGLTFYDGKMKLLVSTDNQSSSALRLSLSTDSTYANPAEAVGVDISLNNTSSTPLILAKSDNWPRNDLSSGSCSNLPFGIAILKGYYTEQNMTGASSLVIYQNIPCPNPASIKSYTFQPLSSKATQECDSLFSCPGLVDMKIHLKVDGFMDNNGQHRPFNVGTYTIVGGDEWGHVAIQHFTEAYATALAGVK